MVSLVATHVRGKFLVAQGLDVIAYPIKMVHQNHIPFLKTLFWVASRTRLRSRFLPRYQIILASCG